MKISEHADHTEKLFNVRGEDIHKWIDGYFDRESFDQFIQFGKKRNQPVDTFIVLGIVTNLVKQQNCN
jgi:CBS domain-containing protein